MKLLTLYFLIFALLSSCSEYSQSGDLKGTYFERKALKQAFLVVCWFDEDPMGEHLTMSQDFAGLRELVKNNSSREFARTNFQFLGWLPCSEIKPTFRHIRIGIGQDLGGNYIGYALGSPDFNYGDQFLYQEPAIASQAEQNLMARNRFPNVLLARNYVSPQDGQPSSPLSDQVLLGVVLHELGHVVGLAHEHLRGDFQIESLSEGDRHCLEEEQQGQNLIYDENLKHGKADMTSIMNYCRHNMEQVSFSERDVHAINQLYPVRASQAQLPSYRRD